MTLTGLVTVPFSSVFPVVPGIIAYVVVSLCTKHSPTENTARVADVVAAAKAEKNSK